MRSSVLEKNYETFFQKYLLEQAFVAKKKKRRWFVSDGYFRYSFRSIKIATAIAVNAANSDNPTVIG